MTEEELEQRLNGTTDFLERQRLLKRLWKLRRQPEAQATSIPSIQIHDSSQSRQRVASRKVASLVT